MMCGLPSSGKSYKAAELSKQYNAEIFSSDVLRSELYGNVEDQEHNQELFTELHRRIKECLKSGKSAIYDACNINYKRRKSFLQDLNRIDCEKICVLVATPYEKCLKRNSERERKVPEHAIKRMYNSFNIPYWYEGWDDIVIEYGEFEGCFGKPVNFYNEYKKYNQHNTHHSLSLGDHCRKCAISLDETVSLEAICAAYIHDCGKPETATFVNSKGDVTEQCHYYNHQYVSGYKALFFDYPNQLDVAIRTMWHMQPYFWEKDNNEKLHNKYKKLWGEDLYNDIMLLHAADKNAH